MDYIMTHRFKIIHYDVVEKKSQPSQVTDSENLLLYLFFLNHVKVAKVSQTLRPLNVACMLSKRCYS